MKPNKIKNKKIKTPAKGLFFHKFSVFTLYKVLCDCKFDLRNSAFQKSEFLVSPYSKKKSWFKKTNVLPCFTRQSGNSWDKFFLLVNIE